MKNAGAMLLVAALLVCGSGITAAQQGDTSIIVEVTDTAGQPLKHACVTFVPKTGDIVFRKADSRGRLKVRRLQRGKYRVVVKVDGYEAQKREVSVENATDTVAFVLKPKNDR